MVLRYAVHVTVRRSPLDACAMQDVAACTQEKSQTRARFEGQQKKVK